MGAAMWFFTVIAGLGLMLALTPIISHHVGANNHPLIREELRQGVWLALALSLFQMLTLLAMALLMPWIGHRPRDRDRDAPVPALDLLEPAAHMPLPGAPVPQRIHGPHHAHALDPAADVAGQRAGQLPADVRQLRFPANGRCRRCLVHRHRPDHRLPGALHLHLARAALCAIPPAPAHDPPRLGPHRHHRAAGRPDLHRHGHGGRHVHRHRLAHGPLRRGHRGRPPDRDQHRLHHLHDSAGHFHRAHRARGAGAGRGRPGGGALPGAAGHRPVRRVHAVFSLSVCGCCANGWPACTRPTPP